MKNERLLIELLYTSSVIFHLISICLKQHALTSFGSKSEETFSRKKGKRNNKDIVLKTGKRRRIINITDICEEFRQFERSKKTRVSCAGIVRE